MSEPDPSPVGEGAIYDPARHRPLQAKPWSAQSARSAISQIVEDFTDHGDEHLGWPPHPLDSETKDPRWCAFNGAAGAVTALRILHVLGIDAPDLTGWVPSYYAAWRKNPDEGPETGLQLGEVGLLTSAAMSRPDDDELVGQLERAIAATVGHPAHEITSGETGVMHATHALFRSTGDARWRELWQRCAASLLESWRKQSESDQWVWRNEIFGSVRGYYGACHGVAGNAGALLEARDWLSATQVDEISLRAITTLEAGAIRSGRTLNWPVSGDPSGTRRLVQWCHGAPGVVTSMAQVKVEDASLRARLDALLEAAGRLVWEAGPVAKGSSLCHGTAGNGYAFLSLYRRTGSQFWLDRARQFAMHAIGQCERARSRYGQGRYTLWTGDGGLAVYLHHCIFPEQSAFPGLALF